MKLNFTGDIDGLESGLGKAAELLGFELSEDGASVFVKKTESKRFSLKKQGEAWFIEYGEKNLFFRALGYLVRCLQE